MQKDDDTLQVTISIGEPLQELLIAELVDRGFDSFEQTEQTLEAYASPIVWSAELAGFLRDWLTDNHAAPDFDTVIVPSQNWNKKWEASIQPIDIGIFRINPSWIPEEQLSDRIVIVIDPQMSFGTGYHASTRLALRLLPESLKSGDRVLDAGTGTGILSIAAAKLGARSVFAFDNDPWAAENAQVNVKRNGVDGPVAVCLGEIDCVRESSFDLVLANIHLTVIEDMMPTFRSRLARSGRIIVSGLLHRDRDHIQTVAGRSQLTIVQEATEDEWFAATLESAGH